VLKRLLLLSGFAFVYMAARHWEERPIEYPPGVLVSQSPVQVTIGPAQFNLEEYLVTKRASFEIRARVLSSRRYYLGREADLSPIDLALGWGPMSDQSVLDQIEISQSGRWYRTRWDRPAPLTDEQVIQNSGNMHMIPAAKSIAKDLKGLRDGDLVTLRGFLVDIDHESGWHWRTSLSRQDTGAGACEIVFVESVLLER